MQQYAQTLFGNGQNRMIELREMQLLTALSRHKHFARAAAECGISQPAFSMRIRALEDRLGVAIVRRGNRFMGLTPQGILLVERSLGILEDVRGLEQEIRAADGPVAGSLTFAVVPTALAQAGAICSALYKRFPKVLVQVESATSLAIQQGIVDGLFDAGLTYVDGVSTDLMTVEPIYEETYVLLAPADMLDSTVSEVPWSALADMPLCLLDGQMQNRRILDQVFAQAGIVPNVVNQANGFTSALMMVQQGVAAAIVPKGLVDAFKPIDTVRVVPLVDPVESKSIGFVTTNRRGGLPIVQALRDTILNTSL